MDLYKFKFDGVYDLRTLKELKNQGIDHFCFEFNPRSFNFIQERVFLDLLVNVLNETDKIFLHFTSNKDFMAIKIYQEILLKRGNLINIFYEFDEYFEEIDLPPDLNFYVVYSPSIFLIKSNLSQLIGFIFPYSLLDLVSKESNLIHFYSNFFMHFKLQEFDSKILIVKLDWNEIPNPKLFDVFDFNIISFPLNSDIESCYRNVDLNKLKSQFDNKKKIFTSLKVLQEF